MKDKKKMVPEIRFKGFEDDWEQRKLGEVVKINGRIGFRGYTQADIIRKEDGGILAFSPTNIINNKLDFNVKNTYITKDKYYESPEIMVKNGDILFVKTGSTLGKSASVSNLNEEATINPQIVILRATSYFISEFISSYLISNNILKQVAQTRIGGAVPTLTETEIKRFQISAPKGKEQQKIGTLFKQLDDTIALHQRKYDLLKRMKQAILDNLFPTGCREVPQIRFADFNKVWKRHKFEKIWKRTSKKNKDLKFSTSDILSVAKMKYSDAPKNSTTEYMKTYFVLKKGDIAFEGNKSKKYSFGRFVLNDVADGIVSHVFITFEPIIPMDIHFMKEYINYEKIMKHKLVKSTTKTLMMTTLNVRDIKKQILSLPSLDEQQKIGSFFQKINKTINLHQRKVTELNSLKKVLLNKLFV